MKKELTTIAELKRTIRSIVKECYGWPVESEIELYGATKKPKKAAVVAVTVNEGYNRPSSRELEEWSKGNWSDLTEGVTDPCDGCDNMFPPETLVRVDGGQYMCPSCEKASH